jgi:hypothetical protein
MDFDEVPCVCCSGPEAPLEVFQVGWSTLLLNRIDHSVSLNKAHLVISMAPLVTT